MSGPSRRAAIAITAALLAGCAAPPVRAPGLIAGRIAVRVEAAGNEPARQMSADFELQGDSSRGEMRLFTPLGTTIGSARWDPSQAVLVTVDGQVHYGSLEALARDVLGEAMPLHALADWLAGHPWHGASSEAAPSGFTQLGWQVDLSGRTEGRVTAVRASAPAVTVRIRLEPSS